MRFHCRLSGLNLTGSMYRAKRLFEHVNGRPYRLIRGAPEKNPGRFSVYNGRHCDMLVGRRRSPAHQRRY